MPAPRVMSRVSPALSVVGWLAFGPRPRTSENTLRLSLIWPVLYIGWTFAHGAVAHSYPYPFTNVDRFGYVDVIRNGAILNLVLVGVGALYVWLDHRPPPTVTAFGSSVPADR